MVPRGRVRREPSESIGRLLSAWTRSPLRCSKPSRRALLLPRRVDGDALRLGAERGAPASAPQGCGRPRQGRTPSAEVVHQVWDSGLTLRWFLRSVRRARVVTRQRACEHPGTEPRNGVSASLLHRQRRKLNADWTAEPWQTLHVRSTGGQSRPAFSCAYVRGSSVITLSAARSCFGPTALGPDYAVDSPVSARKRADLGGFCGNRIVVPAASAQLAAARSGSSLQLPAGPTSRPALVNAER